MTGNIVSAVNRRGQQANFSYDALNRVVNEQYADGSQVAVTYDAPGRAARVVDSTSGTFESTYDLAGRVVKSIGPFGVVAYTRDASGLVRTRQVTGQPEVDYAYDATQNLVSAATTGASVAFTYDVNDALQSASRSNGVKGTYVVDAEGAPYLS